MDDNSERKRGRGRPLKDGAKRIRFDMLMDESEGEMLNHLNIETDMSKAEIMRKALVVYYNMKIRRR